MPDEKRNPDVYEELYIMNIESQYKLLIYNIENFCTRLKGGTITSEDLQHIIDLINLYDIYFLSFEPMANRLDKIGKIRLSIRLKEILADSIETKKIFNGLIKILSFNKKGDLIYLDRR